jgi:hypothetical protein
VGTPVGSGCRARAEARNACPGPDPTTQRRLSWIARGTRQIPRSPREAPPDAASSDAARDVADLHPPGTPFWVRVDWAGRVSADAPFAIFGGRREASVNSLPVSFTISTSPPSTVAAIWSGGRGSPCRPRVRFGPTWHGGTSTCASPMPHRHTLRPSP